MDRTAALLSISVLLCACKGKDGETTDEGGTAGSDVDPLPVTSGEFESEGQITEDSCGNDEGDRLDDFVIKFDQVETGLSILYDPDIGWVPCEGSIRSFRCEWGNAPADTPAGVWSWSLVGTTTDDGTLSAKLTLEITCDRNTNDCDECTIVAEIEGEVD